MREGELNLDKITLPGRDRPVGCSKCPICQSSVIDLYCERCPPKPKNPPIIYPTPEQPPIPYH